jgi:hypothetical protein
VAKGKARTAAQKERTIDLRIQSDFGGFTLADRTKLCESQNNKCAICGGALIPYPIIDHFHFKVEAHRYLDITSNELAGWEAYAIDESGHREYWRRAKTKEQAIKNVKHDAIRVFIRGILCVRCNRGLGMIERFFPGVAQNPRKLFEIYNYLGKRLRLTPVG